MKKLIGYGFAVVFTTLLSLQSLRIDFQYSADKGIDANVQLVEVNKDVIIAYLAIIGSCLGVGAVDDPGIKLAPLLQLLSKYKNK